MPRPGNPQPDLVILEPDLLFEWFRDSVPSETVDPETRDSTPVVLLGGARAAHRAAERDPAGTAVRPPFSPLELVRQLELMSAEPGEVQ